MRQADDGVFADLLLRLAEGRCTAADVQLLQGRVGVRLDAAPFSTAPIVVSRNVLRRSLNRRATLAYAASAGQTLRTVRAVDEAAEAPGFERQLQRALEQLPEAATGNLATTLLLAIGMPVVLTDNVHVPLGLANGATGRLLGVCDGVSSSMPAFVLVRFDDTTADTLPALPAKVVPVWPRTTKVTLAVQRTGMAPKRVSVKRTQLPLAPGWCTTAYKVQGMTLPAVVVDLAKPRGRLDPAYAYVALSRVRRLRDVAILRPFAPAALVTHRDELKDADGARLRRLAAATRARLDPAGTVHNPVLSTELHDELAVVLSPVPDGATDVLLSEYAIATEPAIATDPAAAMFQTITIATEQQEPDDDFLFAAVALSGDALTPASPPAPVHLGGRRSLKDADPEELRGRHTAAAAAGPHIGRALQWLVDAPPAQPEGWPQVQQPGLLDRLARAPAHQRWRFANGAAPMNWEQIVRLCDQDTAWADDVIIDGLLSLWDENANVGRRSVLVRITELQIMLAEHRGNHPDGTFGLLFPDRAVQMATAERVLTVAHRRAHFVAVELDLGTGVARVYDPASTGQLQVDLADRRVAQALHRQASRLGRPIPPLQIEPVLGNVARQPDANSCGLYAALYVFVVLAGLPFDRSFRTLSGRRYARMFALDTLLQAAQEEYDESERL
jgi:hypothetical protein